MISSPTAEATASPNRNGPINSAMVESNSALRGLIARDATIVATMLGALNMPVSMSITSASATNIARAIRLSTIAQHDPILLSPR
jgi:hypothetical protein